MERCFGRSCDAVRPIVIVKDIAGNAHGSVLFQLGHTKVLCTAFLQDGVPSFLKGSGTGWLTAEYAMLPLAGDSRCARESVTLKRNGRSMEISRLIGRALRSCIDLSVFGEKTLYIDCDVIQADGGTRTAAINGAYCALMLADQRWVQEKMIRRSCIKNVLAAVSIGLKDGNILVDVDCAEDVAVDADFNFVMAQNGDLVELQGATENEPIAWEYVELMRGKALEATKDIIASYTSLCNDA